MRRAPTVLGACINAEFDLHTKIIFPLKRLLFTFLFMAASPNAADDMQTKDKWGLVDDQDLDDMAPVTALDQDTTMDDLRPTTTDDLRALVASGDMSGDYDKGKDDSARDRPPKVLKSLSCFVVSSCWRWMSSLYFASCWRRHRHSLSLVTWLFTARLSP